MKVKTLFGAAAASVLLSLAPAHAALYNYTYTDSTFSIAGQITTANTLNGVGGYDVTAITGTVTGPSGASISGLIANPSPPNVSTYTNPFGGYWLYDNVLYSSSPRTDYNGLLFAAGSYIYNIYYSDGDRLSTNNPAGQFLSPEIGTFAVAAVPEPSTWAMMILGFGGLAWLGWRRRRAAVAA